MDYVKGSENVVKSHDGKEFCQHIFVLSSFFSQERKGKDVEVGEEDDML